MYPGLPRLRTAELATIAVFLVINHHSSSEYTLKHPLARNTCLDRKPREYASQGGKKSRDGQVVRIDNL